MISISTSRSLLRKAMSNGKDAAANLKPNRLSPIRSVSNQRPHANVQALWRSVRELYVVRFVTAGEMDDFGGIG
ncbi:hypothetical protein GJ744_011935 [Endocarpon pusillum]|uniref:Uncharacterized protein n=1 Tax=Endocarpon pusillum TaxID=364733 RepID=A0A8H7E877_9EURO|nr:hypothetical protein GJ744_011935 [Endocarpon pusillum]